MEFNNLIVLSIMNLCLKTLIEELIDMKLPSFSMKNSIYRHALGQIQN